MRCTFDWFSRRSPQNRPGDLHPNKISVAQDRGEIINFSLFTYCSTVKFPLPGHVLEGSNSRRMSFSCHLQRLGHNPWFPLCSSFWDTSTPRPPPAAVRASPTHFHQASTKLPPNIHSRVSRPSLWFCRRTPVVSLSQKLDELLQFIRSSPPFSSQTSSPSLPLPNCQSLKVDDRRYLLLSFCKGSQ